MKEFWRALRVRERKRTFFYLIVSDMSDNWEFGKESGQKRVPRNANPYPRSSSKTLKRDDRWEQVPVGRKKIGGDRVFATNSKPKTTIAIPVSCPFCDSGLHEVPASDGYVNFECIECEQCFGGHAANG